VSDVHEHPDEGGDVESPPSPVVEHFFGDRADLARAFAGHLATSAVTRGLIGPRELPRLWTRHVLNCAAVSPIVPARARLADVGSGAGLPGLVVAIARPDVEVTLVEPLLRRVTWLEEVSQDIGLTNVRAVRARAEELPKEAWDVATARAVAPLDKLARWCLPLARPGGLMLAIKGRTAWDELASAEATLRQAGADDWRVVELGGGVLDEPTVVVEAHKGKATTATRSRRTPVRSSSRGPRRR
jgi:16S rRNA (guanine527-N7)-methyltransferase